MRSSVKCEVVVKLPSNTSSRRQEARTPADLAFDTTQEGISG